MTDTPIIQAHDLTKTYAGGVEAVKGIDLEVATGEVFGLLGPNGAGKIDHGNATAMAVLSLGVLILFAVAFTAISMRTFMRSAVT